jgi:hypothetical protein
MWTLIIISYITTSKATLMTVFPKFDTQEECILIGKKYAIELKGQYRCLQKIKKENIDDGV